MNQSTESNVAISTCSAVRHGPLGFISSVLNKPITDPARALSVPRNDDRADANETVQAHA